MAVCSGLTAGFLASPEGEAEGFDGLFANIDIIGGNSGGSWWTTNTVYAKEIPEMQEKMAENPSQAAPIYFTEFSAKGLLRRRLNEEILDPLAPDTCPAFSGFYASVGMSQADYIGANFLGRVSSIAANATLSSEPNSWAVGKIFLLGTTLLTPGSQDGDNRKVWVHFTRPNSSVLTEFNGSLSYTARSGENGAALPAWTPAKFAFRLGDAPGAGAPVPFCANADCHGVFLEYTGYSEDTGESFSAVTPPLSQVIQPAFVEGAGSLLLSQVLSASNAAGGSAIVSAPEQEGGGFPPGTPLRASCPMLAEWQDKDSWGYPFMADDQITDELVSATAASGLHALTDGAFTDNTVVASALSVLTHPTGCSETRKLSVTAWLSGTEIPFGIGALFPGATNFSLGPVCSSPTQGDVADLLANSSYVAPPFSAAYLTRIHYGTIKCPTVDNEWFGVRAGFMVDIHFIWVVTPVSIAATAANFRDHDGLAGEIVQTMAYYNETLMEVADMIFRNATDLGGSTTFPEAETSGSTTQAEMPGSTTQAETPGGTTAETPVVTTQNDGDADAATTFFLFPSLSLAFSGLLVRGL